MRDTAKEAPDFVNDEGVKWWHEADLTRYAFSKGFAGVRVWTVERPDGYKTRLFTEKQSVLAEDQNLEGLGIKIDLLAFQRQTPNDRVEGRDAASSRRVPSHDGLCGNGNYNERTDK